MGIEGSRDGGIAQALGDHLGWMLARRSTVAWMWRRPSRVRGCWCRDPCRRALARVRPSANVSAATKTLVRGFGERAAGALIPILGNS